MPASRAAPERGQVPSSLSPSSGQQVNAADALTVALAVRAEWLAAGLAAEPADTGAAEAAISELYRLAGAPTPTFTWVASPAAGIAEAAGSQGTYARLARRT